MRPFLAFAALVPAFLALSALGSQKPPAKVKPNGGVEQELIRLDQVWNEAEVRGDTAALERLLSDDFVSVGLRGTIQARAEVLEDFRSGDAKLTSLVADDYRVRIYGETAVMTHRATLKGTYKGQDISNTYRTTHVWVKQHGRWQVVASQQTGLSGR